MNQGRLGVARRLLETAALRKKQAFTWWKNINNKSKHIELAK